jgi:hypothetical protein
MIDVRHTNQVYQPLGFLSMENLLFNPFDFRQRQRARRNVARVGNVFRRLRETAMENAALTIADPATATAIAYANLGTAFFTFLNSEQGQRIVGKGFDDVQDFKKWVSGIVHRNDDKTAAPTTPPPAKS